MSGSQAARRNVTPNAPVGLSDTQFRALREVITAHVGIEVDDAKRELVNARLLRRLQASRVDSVDRYISLLKLPDSPELQPFINAMTTHMTSFFRESHHFEFLARETLPVLLARNRDSRRLRIWSAGCSSGPEPFSVAMVLAEHEADLAHWDAKILATDVSLDVVDQGDAAMYSQAEVEGLGATRLDRWFERTAQTPADWRIVPALRALVFFRQLNLIGLWPMQRPFDVIFCRNVMIYFNADTQRRLVDRFAQILAPGGYLFVGHSESLLKHTDRFSLVAKNTYVKER